MNFKVGDSVKVISANAQKTFGIKSDQILKVVSSSIKGLVTLSNGISISDKHLILHDALTRYGLAALVVESIGDFIDNDKMFTAYDVTKDLRKDNPHSNIPHNDVKAIVEEVYSRDFELERELVDIGVPVKPWVYYSEGQDPKRYNKDSKNNDSGIKFVYKFV